MVIFDREELLRVRDGDSEAFRKLFTLFYVPLVQHAAFYVLDRDVAEDIVQDVFTRTWDNRRKIKAEDNLEGYLLRMVRNSCFNYIKHRKVTDSYRQKYMAREVSVVETDPESYYKAIYELIARLPEKRRQVFEMNVFGSMTYAQIAEAAGISVNTVKDHIKAAYSFLRKESSVIPYP